MTLTKNIELAFINRTKANYKNYLKRQLQCETKDTFIDKEIFEKLIISECVYCGFKPDGKNSWNSIDRIDSNKGYKKNNIVPAYKHCNYVKGSLELDLFKEWIKRLVDNVNNKNGICH